MLRFLSVLITIVLLLVARAQADTRIWEPVGLSGGGAMFNPVVSPADPRTGIVHCDMSAAYLTHDGGVSWKMIHTAELRSNTLCRAAFHPTDPRIIFSPHGSSEIKVTRDGGEHWESVTKFDAPLTGAICIDPRNSARIFVGAGKTTRLSTDTGKNWSQLNQVTGAFLNAYFAPTGKAYIATEDGIWQSNDDNWTDISATLPTKGLRGFTGGTAGNVTTLYCTLPGKAVNNAYEGGIFRWQSDTQTWQSANGIGLNLDVKPFDEWARNSVAQYFEIATTDANPGIVYAANANTGIPPPHHASIYRSDDAGKTWRPTFQPDPRYPNLNVEKSYIAVEDGQFYQHAGQISLDPRNPDYVLQISGGDCYFTIDGGKTWRCGHIQAAGKPERGCAWKCTGLVVTTTWHYYVDPHEPNRHYICYTDIGFARSVDAGKTWIWWNNSAAPWRNTTYELAFDPDRPGKIFAAFSDTHDIPNGNIIFNRHRPTYPGGIGVSDDFAVHWKHLTDNGLPKTAATSIILDPSSPRDSRTLYAAFFGTGVFKSTDDGRTWTAKNTGLGDPSNMRVYRIQRHPDGTLFALITALTKNNQFQEKGAGLYRSANGGDSWELITQSISALWPKDFSLDPADSKVIYLGLCDANNQQIGGLYRTTDAGKSWNLLTRQGREHFGGYLHPKNPGWIYATLCEGPPTYGLYLSKDNGKTFAPLKGLPFDNAMRVTVDPADPTMIYVTTFGGSIWHGPAD